MTEKKDKRITLCIRNGVYEQLEEYLNNTENWRSMTSMLNAFIISEFERRTSSYTAIQKERLELKKKRLKETSDPVLQEEKRLEAEKAKKYVLYKKYEDEVWRRGGYMYLEEDTNYYKSKLPTYEVSSKTGRVFIYGEILEYADEVYENKVPYYRQFGSPPTEKHMNFVLEKLKANGQSFEDKDLNLRDIEGKTERLFK